MPIKRQLYASKTAPGKGAFVVARVVVHSSLPADVYALSEYNDRRDADAHVREIERFDDNTMTARVLEVGRDVERITSYKLNEIVETCSRHGNPTPCDSCSEESWGAV